MNGDTRLKIQGGIVGGAVGLIITLSLAFWNFSYSYGAINNRIEEVEKKANCIYEVRERLATLEAHMEILIKVKPILENIERKMQ